MAPAEFFFKRHYLAVLVCLFVVTHFLVHKVEVEKAKSGGGDADGLFTTKLTEKGDGTFLVGYTTQRAGTYHLHVSLGLASPVPIHGSPFELTVLPGPLSPAHCELTMPTAAPLDHNARGSEKHPDAQVRA